ncbi:hypothetical protein [Leptotrichia trevisanii]|uniref:Uncharacterized protein n=1 Tax=Leptotrichia trevisanii TaxID=109328 RepID=A0A510K217_9FUSO|nr:hypothetical protein [Leptotrichia trevisanii]BBM45708.1 hypothetical protein JMUB3870_1828 [Leptotrichia trevisanii]
MKKIMNFVLLMLCLFSCNIAVNAAAKVNSVVQEIRNEKDRTDKEKLVVRKEEVDDGPVGEVSYYYKGNILKKIVSHLYFETGNEYREYYIKNNRVYFIYSKLTSTEHVIWTDNPKVLGIYETRYYFDSNGKIVRYVDENGKIHENNRKMKEADQEIRRFKLNFLGNRL